MGKPWWRVTSSYLHNTEKDVRSPELVTSCSYPANLNTALRTLSIYQPLIRDRLNLCSFQFWAFGAMVRHEGYKKGMFMEHKIRLLPDTYKRTKEELHGGTEAKVTSQTTKSPNDRKRPMAPWSKTKHSFQSEWSPVLRSMSVSMLTYLRSSWQGWSFGSGW